MAGFKRKANVRCAKIECFFSKKPTGKLQKENDLKNDLIEKKAPGLKIKDKAEVNKDQDDRVKRTTMTVEKSLTDSSKMEIVKNGQEKKEDTAQKESEAKSTKFDKDEEDDASEINTQNISEVSCSQWTLSSPVEYIDSQDEKNDKDEEIKKEKTEKDDENNNENHKEKHNENQNEKHKNYKEKHDENRKDTEIHGGLGKYSEFKLKKRTDENSSSQMAPKKPFKKSAPKGILTEQGGKKPTGLFQSTARTRQPSTNTFKVWSDEIDGKEEEKGIFDYEEEEENEVDPGFGDDDLGFSVPGLDDM